MRLVEIRHEDLAAIEAWLEALDRVAPAASYRAAIEARSEATFREPAATAAILRLLPQLRGEPAPVGPPSASYPAPVGPPSASYPAPDRIRTSL